MLMWEINVIIFLDFLGVLYHNENSTDGILEILKELHSYVPFAGDDENRVYADQGVVANRVVEEDSQNQNVGSEDSTDSDNMLAYQKALMEYGLLLLNFTDSVSEGDGDRNLCCWRFFLL